MSLSQITDIHAFPYGRIDPEVGSEESSPGRLLGGAARFLPGSRPARAPLPSPRTPVPGSGPGVLSARPFQDALERERTLSDRGTRRFSVIALRRRARSREQRRERQALRELARRVCARLRTTDLVGRPDADRVEILLTDTEPAGAHVVAVWVEQIQAILRLDLELTICVYPSVIEPHHDDGDDPAGPEGNGGSRRMRLDSGHRFHPHEGATTPHLALLSGRNGHASQRTAGRWPLEDLWPRLGRPTPFWKRSLDIVISSLALLALFPLFALIAIAIRLDTPGPIFFKHLRAGRGGRPFAFYKFRSMIRDAETHRAALALQNEKDGPIFKIRNDPRITRVGRLLRRWSLDELPQLWNVLKGDISLVGPRSPTLDEVDRYQRWHRRRLSVIGGITCTWQVSGRSEISFRDWMRLDMRYIACRNLWQDLRLLVLTLPAVISGRGAC
jgi:lipopolysaccharide/colanic/teichoic acid biosynthesis glycosyltransferase